MIYAFTVTGAPIPNPVQCKINHNCKQKTEVISNKLKFILLLIGFRDTNLIEHSQVLKKLDVFFFYYNSAAVVCCCMHCVILCVCVCVSV